MIQISNTNDVTLKIPYTPSSLTRDFYLRQTDRWTPATRVTYAKVLNPFDLGYENFGRSDSVSFVSEQELVNAIENYHLTNLNKFKQSLISPFYETVEVELKDNTINIHLKDFKHNSFNANTFGYISMGNGDFYTKIKFIRRTKDYLKVKNIAPFNYKKDNRDSFYYYKTPIFKDINYLDIIFTDIVSGQITFKECSEGLVYNYCDERAWARSAFSQGLRNGEVRNYPVLEQETLPIEPYFITIQDELISNLEPSLIFTTTLLSEGNIVSNKDKPSILLARDRRIVFKINVFDMLNMSFLNKGEPFNWNFDIKTGNQLIVPSYLYYVLYNFYAFTDILTPSKTVSSIYDEIKPNKFANYFFKTRNGSFDAYYFLKDALVDLMQSPFQAKSTYGNGTLQLGSNVSTWDLTEYDLLEKNPTGNNYIAQYSDDKINKIILKALEISENIFHKRYKDNKMTFRFINAKTTDNGVIDFPIQTGNPCFLSHKSFREIYMLLFAFSTGDYMFSPINSFGVENFCKATYSPFFSLINLSEASAIFTSITETPKPNEVIKYFYFGVIRDKLSAIKNAFPTIFNQLELPQIPTSVYTIFDFATGKIIPDTTYTDAILTADLVLSYEKSINQLLSILKELFDSMSL